MAGLLPAAKSCSVFELKLFSPQYNAVCLKDTEGFTRQQLCIKFDKCITRPRGYEENVELLRNEYFHSPEPDIFLVGALSVIELAINI